jgi:serine/threonine protein phosphatase PrpC
LNAITSIFLERGNPELQDRVEVLLLGERVAFIVADGAGGISGGMQAAERFVRGARQGAPSLTSAEDCAEFLQRLDEEIAGADECGETTGIVLVLNSRGLFGASVGDSAAWLFTVDGKAELTQGQARKPFLGGGILRPHRFEHRFASGTLVVATDGLWKYTGLERIESAVRAGSPEKLAAGLGELVRLRSGGFQDDVGIVTAVVG